MRVVLSAMLSYLFIAVYSYEMFPLSAQTDGVTDQISEKAPTVAFVFVDGINADGNPESNSGSGFVISKEGYVLTTAHIFRDPSKRRPFEGIEAIRVSLGSAFNPKFPSGQIYPAIKVRIDYGRDVALLQLPQLPPKSEGYKFIRVCKGNATEQGSRIFSLGYPLQNFSVNAGVLSSKDGPEGYWKTDIALYHGHSGGPVFRETGQVIGMAKGGVDGMPGQNFFIPSHLLRDYLETGLAELVECPARYQPVSNNQWNIDAAKCQPDSTHHEQDWCTTTIWYSDGKKACFTFTRSDELPVPTMIGTFETLKGRNQQFTQLTRYSGVPVCGEGIVIHAAPGKVPRDQKRVVEGTLLQTGQ